MLHMPFPPNGSVHCVSVCTADSPSVYPLCKHKGQASVDCKLNLLLCLLARQSEHANHLANPRIGFLYWPNICKCNWTAKYPFQVEMLERPLPASVILWFIVWRRNPRRFLNQLNSPIAMKLTRHRLAYDFGLTLTQNYMPHKQKVNKI